MSIERDAHYRRIIKDAIQIGFNNGLRSRTGVQTVNAFAHMEHPNWCYSVAFEMGQAQPLQPSNTPIPSQGDLILEGTESIVERVSRIEMALSPSGNLEGRLRDIEAGLALVRP